jgi:hypothetical protein
MPFIFSVLHLYSFFPLLMFEKHSWFLGTVIMKQTICSQRFAFHCSRIYIYALSRMGVWLCLLFPVLGVALTERNFSCSLVCTNFAGDSAAIEG